MRIDVLTGNGSKQAPELRRQRILDFIVLIIRCFCGALANGSWEINLSNGGDKRDDGDAVDLTQVKFCDRTSGNTAYSFPCAAASSTGGSLDTVLLEVGVICMRRTWVEISLGVVFRTLIFVFDEQCNGCAEGDTVLDTRLYVDKVLFIALWLVKLR